MNPPMMIRYHQNPGVNIRIFTSQSIFYLAADAKFGPLLPAAMPGPELCTHELKNKECAPSIDGSQKHGQLTSPFIDSFDRRYSQGNATVK
jgi:hypothetical protein